VIQRIERRNLILKRMFKFPSDIIDLVELLPENKAVSLVFSTVPEARQLILNSNSIIIKPEPCKT